MAVFLEEFEGAVRRAVIVATLPEFRLPEAMHLLPKTICLPIGSTFRVH
jgi:hypothetical protein